MSSNSDEGSVEQQQHKDQPVEGGLHKESKSGNVVDSESITDHDLSNILPEKLSGVLEQYEMMAVQRRRSEQLSTPKLTESQINTLLSIADKTEDNKLTYQTQRLKTIKEIEIAKIKSSDTNNKTLRYVWLTSIILVIAITTTILFFKDTFFIPWLTFLTGLIGGAGASKAIDGIKANQQADNPLKEEEPKA